MYIVIYGLCKRIAVKYMIRSLRGSEGGPISRVYLLVYLIIIYYGSWLRLSDLCLRVRFPGFSKYVVLSKLFIRP
jgi:hypothetical protein